MPKVTIRYKPRDVFLPYHAMEKRFAVTVAHRRCGKTVARINRIIKEAVCCTKLNPRFGYIAPYFVQSKEIAWRYILHYTQPFIELGAKVNESELSVTLAHNQATIRLYGAENAERIRGLYFDGIVVDEAQGISRSTLSAIILPALADRAGWLDCSGTPKGWSNLLGELVKLARADTDSWFLQVLRASETHIIPADELARQRSLMSENEYAQEFECDFDAAITGAVYGKQIALAMAEGRIKDIEHIDKIDVLTAWDLGYDDATAIWWFQVLQGEIHILDYWEGFGQDIPQCCEVIQNRAKQAGYRYGKHYVPHDAANKLQAAGGRSIVQQADALGVRMWVVPATSQQNGIEAARKTLERCWFDETKCEQGLEALRQYQYLFDPDLKVYRSIPRHDWASHGADAFEIIGQVWRTPEVVKPPAKPKFLSDITFQELLDSTPKGNRARI